MRRALLLSTALLLTACGGGGEDEKQAYVDQASAICEEAVTEFEAVTFPTAPDGFAPYADQVVAILEKTQADLAALEPPADDRAELEQKALRPLGELVEEGRAFAEQVRAAGADQGKLLTLLSERPTPEGIDQEFLRSYGLEPCADAVAAAG
jgi:Tfp pilus assembly protein PilP